MALKSHCQVAICPRVHLCALEVQTIVWDETRRILQVPCDRPLGDIEEGRAPVTPWKRLQIGETRVRGGIFGQSDCI